MKNFTTDDGQGLGLALAALVFLTGCFDRGVATIPEADDVQTTEVPSNSLQNNVPNIDIRNSNDVGNSSDGVDAVRPDHCAIATTTTGNLNDARTIYADVCAGYPRPDCDPLTDGGWQCSSAQIGNFAPPWVTSNPPLPEVVINEPAPVVDTPVVETPVTPPPPAPEVPTPSPLPSGPSVLTAQTETQRNDGWSFVQNPQGFEGEGALVWLGRNNFLLNEAGEGVLSYQFDVEYAGDYEVTVRSHITDGPNQAPQAPDKNNDVWLRVNGGSWIKVFQQNRGSWTNTRPLDVTLAQGVTTVQLSGRSQFFVVDSISLRPENVSAPVVNQPQPQSPTSVDGNLFALHYDVCPDLDDVQAMVANYAILDVQNVRVLPVIGTCGLEIADRYNNGGETLFNKLYPDGLNVDRDYTGSVRAAAAAWEETLDAGYEVLVAEGGQSDFTAHVVRELGNRPDLRNITVVQHAVGYNEGNTMASNLTFLRNTVNYVNIPNGNSEGNGSANLASWQAGIQDPEPFVDAALDSRYAELWLEAFNVLSPYCRPQSFQCRVDFSDSVELLYLTTDTTTTDLASFARTYFQ